MFLMKGGCVGTVSQSLRDCKRQLVGHREFVASDLAKPVPRWLSRVQCAHDA